MVPAQQHHHRFLVGGHHQALDMRGFRQPGQRRYLGDCFLLRRRELLGTGLALGIGHRRRDCPRHSLFEIGGVVALRTGDHDVLPGRRGDRELVGLAAAHRARVRLHRQIAESAAIENPPIGRVMLLVTCVEPLGVDIKRIRVFHREAPDAHQAGFRPRLVAELRLNLIPDLRQLFVTAQLAPRNRGHHLFLGHAEAQVPSGPVLEPEHVVAYLIPASALPPELGRMQFGQEKFLRADRVHFFPDDPLDLQKRAARQKKIAIETRPELANIAGPQQQLMADHFGLGRGLAKSGNE